MSDSTQQSLSLQLQEVEEKHIFDERGTSIVLHPSTKNKCYKVQHLDSGASISTLVLVRFSVDLAMARSVSLLKTLHFAIMYLFLEGIEGRETGGKAILL